MDLYFPCKTSGPGKFSSLKSVVMTANLISKDLITTKVRNTTVHIVLRGMFAPHLIVVFLPFLQREKPLWPSDCFPIENFLFSKSRICLYVFSIHCNNFHLVTLVAHRAHCRKILTKYNGKKVMILVKCIGYIATADVFRAEIQHFKPT